MKAISLWNPWACAVAARFKLLETRGRLTHYRGPLAIHAAASRKPEMREKHAELCGAFPEYLERFPDFDALTFGAVVAVVNLTDCRPITATNVLTLSKLERALGDYRPGRFIWDLADTRLIDPVPFKGGQFFFNVPDELLP